MNSRRWVIFAVSFGIFIGTYDIAAIAVVLPRILKIWHPSPLALTLLTASTFVGMIAGSLAAGILADRWGRRVVLLLDFAAYGLAATVSAMAPDLSFLIISRLIVGIGIGADYAVVFPYLVEYLPVPGRGKVMAWALWAANFGMLVAYAMGALTLSSPNGWRIPLGLGALLVVPLLWFRRSLPESQLWQKHRTRSLAQTLDTFRRQRLWKPVMWSSVIWFSYQVSDQGLSLFLPLMLVTMFNSTVAIAAWHSVLVKAVTIPAALLTVATIERWGRRPLQILGFWGRGLSLVLLSFVLLLPLANPFSLAREPMIAWALLALAYATGAWGPDKTTVITAAEQASTEVRASSQAIAEASGRFGGLLGVIGYSLLSSTYGAPAGILFFGAMAILGAVLSQVTLPETKGLLPLSTPDLLTPALSDDVSPSSQH
ncbi:MAG: MFS transporter [Sulfobacillus sp.]